MKEQFVTYEIAKLLKEKGFNEYCLAYYEIGKNTIQYVRETENPWKNSNIDNWMFVAPLWQQVIYWLEEKHKIEYSASVGYEHEYHESPDCQWRSFNILILGDSPDVIWFEDHIYYKTKKEIINEYFIPEALKLI